MIHDDCTDMDTATVIIDKSVFGWEVYLATLAVWIIVYFIMWKGVNSSSYVVWVTVPLPVIFILIMVMNNLTLENSDAGIRMYLKGYDADGNPPDIASKISNGKMWANACGQIFFSLGICMGTMTSYSSFNDVNKPIIGDGFRIAFTNSGISFVAGFAVFSVVGYLIGQNSPVADKTASIGLAFVAYPAAIDTMPYPNFWSFVLAITLFTLGIDSSFSMLEAAATVMQDSPWFKEWPRKLIALVLCIVGSLCSILFSFNWGFTYFDVVDNYLNNYLMLVLGVLEVMGAAWVFAADKTIAKSRGHKIAYYILAFTFWPLVLLLPPISIWGLGENAWIGMVLFWVLLLITFIVSFAVSGLKIGDWYNEVMFSGVRTLARAMTKLSKSDPSKNEAWEYVFEFWWGFSLKYFCPWALCLLIWYSISIDTAKFYGGYHGFWQVMGMLYPIAGLAVFFWVLIVGSEPEPFEHDVVAALDPTKIGKDLNEVKTELSSSVKGDADSKNDKAVTPASNDLS